MDRTITDNQYKLNNFQIKILAKARLKRQKDWKIIYMQHDFMVTADKVLDKEGIAIEEAGHFTLFTARIINTCVSTDSSGKHWILWVTVRNKEGQITQEIFFDSFGRKPSQFQAGDIKKIGATWSNPFCLQSNVSVVCGIWVLRQLKLIETYVKTSADILVPEKIYQEFNRELPGKTVQTHLEANDRKIVQWLEAFYTLRPDVKEEVEKERMGAEGGNDFITEHQSERQQTATNKFKDLQQYRSALEYIKRCPHPKEQRKNTKAKSTIAIQEMQRPILKKALNHLDPNPRPKILKLQLRSLGKVTKPEKRRAVARDLGKKWM